MGVVTTSDKVEQCRLVRRSNRDESPRSTITAVGGDRG